MRLLFDPNPTEGGGGEPKETPVAENEKQPTEQAQDKAAQQQQPPAQPEPARPAAITLTPAEYDRLRQAEKEAHDFRETERKRLEAEKEAEEARLREQGKVQDLLSRREKELAESHTKLREYEARSKNSERSRALALAMNGQPLVSPAAAAQLTTILLPELDVAADGEGWRVASRDGKSVADFVKEKLASPEYAHFLSADKRGGSGSTGKAQQPAPAQEPEGDSPGERLVAYLKANQKPTSNSGIGWGRN